MAVVAKRAKPYRVIAGVGAGAGAALAMMVVMAILRFTFNFPTIPELMLNPIVRMLGGEAFSAALDRFYYMGRPLLFTSILEGTLLLGVLLGLLYAWLAKPNAQGRRPAIFNSPWGGLLYGLIIGLLLDTVFLTLVEQPVFASEPDGLYAPSSLSLWVGLLLLGLVFGLALQSLLPPVPIISTAPTIQPAGATAGGTMWLTPVEDPERRQLIRIAGGGLAALLGGVVFTLGGTILNQGGLANPVNNTASNASSDEASLLICLMTRRCLPSHPRLALKHLPQAHRPCLLTPRSPSQRPRQFQTYPPKHPWQRLIRRCRQTRHNHPLTHPYQRTRPYQQIRHCRRPRLYR